MKKQLLTLSMCLACAGALSAQDATGVYYKLGKVTDWSQIKSGDKIVIESVSTTAAGAYERNGFFEFVPGETATVTFNRTNNYGSDFTKSFGFLANKFDANKVFVIAPKSEEGVYTLKSVAGDMYLKNNSTGGGNLAFTGEDSYNGFKFEKDNNVADAWNVFCNGSNLKFDANGPAPTLWNSDDPRPFNVYKVTEEPQTYSDMPWSYLAMFATPFDATRMGRCIQVGNGTDATILYNQEGVIDASTGAVNSGGAKQLWRFEESDAEIGRFALVNKTNENVSVGSVSNGDAGGARYHYDATDKNYQFVLSSANGSFEGAGFVNFKRHDSNGWFVNCAASGQSYFVNEWNGGGRESNAWSLVVTSELKAPSNLNGTAIGTFSAPYAVYVPADVTAYVATGESDDCITLTEVAYSSDARILPANTAVILTSETPDFYAMVQTDADPTATNVEDNLLQATGSDRIMTPEAGAYVLGAVDGTVGMYNYTAATVAPFKAYLPKSVSETARVKSIQFPGGGTTGIEETVTVQEDKNAPIYNLNGQRVTNPVKGVYIQNGKKFIVK